MPGDRVGLQARPRIVEVGNPVEAEADLGIAHRFHGQMKLARGGGDVREVVVLAQAPGRIEVKLEDALAQGLGDFDPLPRLGIGRHHGLCLGLGDPQVVVGRLRPKWRGLIRAHDLRGHAGPGCNLPARYGGSPRRVCVRAGGYRRGPAGCPPAGPWRHCARGSSGPRSSTWIAPGLRSDSGSAAQAFIALSRLRRCTVGLPVCNSPRATILPLAVMMSIRPWPPQSDFSRNRHSASSKCRVRPLMVRGTNSCLIRRTTGSVQLEGARPPEPALQQTPSGDPPAPLQTRIGLPSAAAFLRASQTSMSHGIS